MGICCMTQGIQIRAWYSSNNLEGWDGKGGGRDVHVGGDMGKPMASSC